VTTLYESIRFESWEKVNKTWWARRVFFHGIRRRWKGKMNPDPAGLDGRTGENL
jgi:hypothetical protein